ncbi:carboxymuconolactone decarboxylase family protein [Brevibacillus migulae]|uniref:carboxymuconolactone decarboxylase family protein n=1 Tax=Brevibacillus migulae TaxID=1644114 RepID=UPI001430476B|nr:carboxymuconolactone decarboxylase family protein [Brevibacillus migulae]
MVQDAYYLKSDARRFAEWNGSDSLSLAYQSFLQESFVPGNLSRKQKALIATAVSIVLGSAYSIQCQADRAKEEGATKEELTEAMFVATNVKAGAAASHGVNMLNAYDGQGGEELYRSSYLRRLNEFFVINKKNAQSFMHFHHTAMSEGVLSAKDKELIAIACAHTTRCPYCIEVHVRAAKEAGVEKEAISEAVFVAIAVHAEASHIHLQSALELFQM